MKKILSFLSAVAVASTFTSCYDTLIDAPQLSQNMPINLSAHLHQQNVTRADEQGFVTGDRMGIYIVDYVNGVPGVLDVASNRASNVLYTFDGDNYTWTAPTQLYWKDSSTPVDVYGYYPGINYIDEPTAYEFEVSNMQNVVPEEGGMSNYEASDFLWGKTAKVSPTEKEITVSYHHRMAGVWVYLKAGEGITATEWEKLDKIVQIENTVRTATIDLTDGIPVPSGEVDKGIAMLPQSGDSYRAVIVPQKVAAGKKLISVTLDGITYTHSLTSEMNYQMGKIHNFTITINKAEASGDYELKVSYDGITDWVNDETSHQFIANSYIVLSVNKEGTLEDCIRQAKLNPSSIKNLKLTGFLNQGDFEYIKSSMSEGLRSINLASVKIKNGHNGKDDYLPNYAFEGMSYLRQVILPLSLREIGNNAFSSVELFSLLVIPEGVTHIHGGAFYGTTCNIELPYSLEYIGNSAFSSNQVDGVLVDGELKFTDRLKYIGDYAFWRARKMTGTFYLPSTLEYLGESAFESCGNNLFGDIIIPQTLIEIPQNAFADMGFAKGTNVVMHDGVVKVNNSAFHMTRINNIVMSKGLQFIGQIAFGNCGLSISDFSFPERIASIGGGAFQGNYISGKIEMPNYLSVLESGTFDFWIGAANVSGVFSGTDVEEFIAGDNLTYIGKMAFMNCHQLKKVYLGKNTDYIDKWAFGACSSLQTLTCMAVDPPTIHAEAFVNDWGESIYFDKCVLQVPEQSIELYRNANGWREFQNITAYRELAFNVPNIVAMDKGTTRTGILRAEGAWEVAECPSWVTVSPSSGNDKKTEVTVTVDAQNKGVETREGRIVFRLKDKDYTTYTTVRQVAADVAEDEAIVLQEATAGAPYDVPIFMVGDGYNADDIASGKYFQDMHEQMEHLFSVEPYKSYRDYFTVSTAIACSPESGTNEPMKFKSEDYWESEADMVWRYALAHGKDITEAREAYTTILVLYNTEVSIHSTDISDNGRTVSWMGKSADSYPFDQRGYILHELGGTAFAKLGPEGVSHFNFMKDCSCPGCNMTNTYNSMRSKGWYQNVSTSGRMNDVPWSHYIFHEKYAPYVDIYEGALNHSRSTYRSENMSVMGNTYIPYYNTISREIIVRRIMECAGLPFSMEEFLAKDKIELPEKLQN